jgi:SAM-dependent methyltransferase
MEDPEQTKDLGTAVDSVGATWEELAQTDAFYAILSDPEKKGNKWDLAEFLTTGENEINALIHHLAEHEIPFETDVALDFGCGVGRLTQALSRKFNKVYGVDVAPSMILRAQGLNKFTDRCEYVLNGRPDLSLFPDGKFSFILSSIVLQHLPPELARAYLVEFARILRPGGLMVFQLPARFTQAKTLHLEAMRAEIECVNAERNLRAESVNEMTFTVTNTSQFHWHHNEPFALRLGNHWLDPNGSCLVRDDGRAKLPDGIARGGTVSVVLPVKAPARPGSYVLELDVVQEGIAWFADNGSPTLRLEIKVESDMSGAAGSPSESTSAPPDAAASGSVEFEMHCIPRAEVLDLVSASGCKLEFIETTGAGGIGTLSYFYYVRKESHRGPSFKSG